MQSNLKKLFPRIYKNILEIDELVKVGDFQFDEFLKYMDDAHNNQFVMTADERGIEMFEYIYDILANPLSEDLEFRRDRVLLRMRTWPPFSIRWLRGQLDIIIGKDKYRSWLVHDDYALFIEANTEDQDWYHEVRIFVDKIKPANIIYHFRPKLYADLYANETISSYNIQWNYKLDGTWLLGEKPFVSGIQERNIWHYKLDGSWLLGERPFWSSDGMDVIKLATTSSLQPTFFDRHAAFTTDQIYQVEINGVFTNSSGVAKDVSFVVSDFIKKVNYGSETHIEYSIPPTYDIDEIRNIKLLGSSGEILSSAPIFTLAQGGMVIVHVIRHEEGVVNNS